jgi:tetratricopeptide (TPR) repeat protein
VEGLLERYLTTALEPLVTQSRRQAAIKVLLALTDLERNARAGALTFEDLRRKLDEIADSELKDAVAYLLLGDVRLISPMSENEEEKFELAHERLIPALRRLAGKQLSLADRADQLLDRRANEWLGNERSSRYLFSWSELRLINKHRRFVTWGKQRQAKEELLTASRRRFRLRYAALGLAPMLALCEWVGWNSNAWQAYLIKRELRNYGNSLNDSRALTEIAKAFFYAGESQLALQVVERTSNSSDKANALIEIAEFYARLGDKERASALLSDAIRAAERVIDNGPKAIALMSIAKSYASVGDKEKARALLLDITKTSEQINNEFSKASTLSEIVEFYVKLAESSDDPALYEVSFRLIERLRDDSSKNQALDAILSSKFALADIGRLRSLTSHYGVGGPGKARALARILMACSRPDLIGKESNLQYR